MDQVEDISSKVASLGDVVNIPKHHYSGQDANTEHMASSSSSGAASAENNHVNGNNEDTGKQTWYEEPLESDKHGSKGQYSAQMVHSPDSSATPSRIGSIDHIASATETGTGAVGQQPSSSSKPPISQSKSKDQAAMPPPTKPSRAPASFMLGVSHSKPQTSAAHSPIVTPASSASVSRANSSSNTPHKSTAAAPPNPNGTTANNTSAPAPAPAAAPTPISTTATPSKNPVSRLQRIFSQSSVNRQNNKNKPSGNTNTEETNSTNGSEAGASAVPNSSSSANQNSKPSRFTVYDDGSHTHRLRPAKRQEKLGKMLKDFLAGNSKKREEERAAKEAAADSQHQLSLVQSWINGYGQEKLADKKDPGKVSASFVEKYGRCQEVIGRGAFGVVRISHKVDPQNSRSELLYAVKEFRRKPSESQKKYTKRLTSEFCISSSLRHPNVIHTLDLIQDNKGDYCEVMELCSGGDLYTLIMAAGRLEPMEADCFLKQLMRGVDYLHDMGVAHRDLKPENLLLTINGSIKITDFGNGECFRMAWEKEAHMTCGLCGSAPYIAPEEYTEKEFDPRAVDVWACGVIYMAMRTGRHLWRVAKKSEDEFYAKYLMDRKNESGYEPIEMLERSRCRNTLYNILHPNPGYRLTAKQIMKSEWVRSIKLCEYGAAGL
ncbi:HAL protein kinase Hal4 [Schizosaccharomyces cryophilus OY26]|uniref:non-specific serine/threonine protein kinase n=1 Tax=Schizosaccharomyces cryophilus (strain OY26 / ATCC MYA-4695 / CBS 11777 / NBRC 106824 / NRRL Y48691) TaxID=653667 RepID=S9VQK9_SCHCR|nr:HAL protein kinase Hal4 [Schizosaccharomyces cryophilus OY26]EPY50238.1 HAL protein kinase Hal4 [Schizosaccharomyces cryophilus OY26]